MVGATTEIGAAQNIKNALVVGANNNGAVGKLFSKIISSDLILV